MKPVDNLADKHVRAVPADLSYAEVARIVTSVRGFLKFHAVDIQVGDLRISVERKQADAPAQFTGAATEAAATKSSSGDVVAVLAPSLGMFQHSAYAGGPVLAQVGRVVSAADCIGAIDVLRRLIEVRAGVNGEIVEVHAGDAVLVEFGQPLVRIRRM